MNQTDFKTIPLSEIHPDKNQPRKFFNESALKELTESVKSKGVLQPIMVRPNGKGYILVCGERRYKASLAAGLKDVPAVVRNLSDQEALEIQFIENIQRDDVHPMDEATTFKSMLENKVKAYTIADIAAKINKPEKFVVQRLSLNNLIPGLQNEFWKGEFLIGHAVLFSKLSPEDQKDCLTECKEHIYLNNNKSVKQYKTINEVKSFIERNIIRVLSSAPFKKDDATLNPEMGACTSCPFRSGNNPSLFDDVKETDRCFKPVCFEKKINVHLLRTVKTVLEEEPETMFLMNSYGNTSPEILKLLKDFKVTPIKNYDDFSSYIRKGDKKIKGIWINGDEVGKIQHVALNERSKAGSSKTTDGKPSSNSIDMEVAGIKQRTKRAAELDDEKVWRRIHDEIIHDKALLNDSTLSKVDTAALLQSMHKNIGYSYADKFEKIFGTTDDDKLVDKYLDATSAQFNQAARLYTIASLDSVVGSHRNPHQKFLKMQAEQYHKDKIATIELEQQEKRTKREERAGVRIKALQDQKKQTVVKPAPAAKPNKSSKKKAVKK